MNVFKSESGKSEGTRFLKDNTFKACHVRQDVPWWHDADLVCVDMMNLFHSILKHDWGRITWRTAIERIMRVPNKLAHHNVFTLALCFDYIDAVPEVKKEEQMRRDNNVEELTSDSEESDVWEPLRHRFKLDAAIPTDWSKKLSDRKGFRESMIQWLKELWISGEMPLPYDRCGEVVLMGPEPISVRQSTVPNKPEVTRSPYIDNFVGEAENQFVLLCKSGDYKRCGLVATDSDVLYIAMWHNLPALWVYDRKDLTVALDVQQCMRQIPNPRELVMVSYAAGSDYTSAWGRLTHSRFIKTWLAKKVKTPLLDKDGKTPSLEGFEELLMATAMGTKKRTREELEKTLAFPSREFVHDRFLQLKYALNMVDKADDPDPDFGDPLAFGYVYDENLEIFKRKSRGVPKK